VNIKTDPIARGTIRTHGNSNRLLEDLTTNNYIYIVSEEFQHLFNFNFRVLVRGIRVIAKTHESHTNYAHIFVSARSVRRMRNSSVERTWTVSDCLQVDVRRRRFVRDFEF
jgi:hypothetical protein